MAPQSRTLAVQFLDTWHVGTGRARGRHLDAVVDRDADDLPFVPGRMLKGLLRDAVQTLQVWGHVPADAVVRLFGSASQGDGETDSGCLLVSAARLPKVERTWLASDAGRSARAALYLEQFQTAIDAKSGTAMGGTLRGIELVVPLTLQAELAIELSSAEASACWQQIDLALPLVHALGAMKTRGQGRVQLAWLQGESA